MKSYLEWYCSEGILWDVCDGKRLDGRLMSSGAWVSVFNPDPERTANVDVTFYFPAYDPIVISDVSIAPLKTHKLEVHHPGRIPTNTHYAIGITADSTVVPQHTVADFRPFELVPNDMETVTLYSGPLGYEETAWFFTDSWMGYNDARSWYEFETLSLLNPSDQVAEVELQFLGVSARLTGKDNMAFERKSHVTVEPRSVLPIRLWDLPELTFKGGVNRQGQHDRTADFSTFITSTVPIVPQKTRRCYRQFERAVQGQWTVIGTPCGGKADWATAK